MTTKKNSPKNQSMNITNICERIVNENIMIEEVSIEYKRATERLVTRADGRTALSLTSTFTQSIQEQMLLLRNEIVMPLVFKVKHNFTLTAKVDSTGNLNFDELHIEFRLDCRKRYNTHETFRVPLKVLVPFTEYIDYLNLRGHDYELSVIHAEVNISQIDLQSVLEQPIRGDKAQAQWYSFIMEAEQEAQKEYKLDVVIPVSEGEVTWNIPHNRKLQFIENFRSTGIR